MSCVGAKRQQTLFSWLTVSPLVRRVVQESILTPSLLAQRNANAHKALYGLITLDVRVKIPMQFC
jgi:hypothetical protein